MAASLLGSRVDFGVVGTTTAGFETTADWLDVANGVGEGSPTALTPPPHAVAKDRDANTATTQAALIPHLIRNSRREFRRRLPPTGDLWTTRPTHRTPVRY